MNKRWIWICIVSALLLITGCSSHQDAMEPPPADAAINNNAPEARTAPAAPANPYVPRPAMLKSRRS